MTVYLNMKTNNQTETVDQFTRGEDAPQDPRKFRKYVNEMVREYHMSGMPVYKSSRACKDWK
jgi:benzoyl-CoA reductase/2-hydroxyglutaryl-CoA dehydratase subunit BcrC/BadD/HgdB